MHRIEAELLIPGHGGPIRDGVVLEHVNGVWTRGRLVKGARAAA